MILRKPYAFLIKRFRLIHFILFGLILYILLSTKSLVDNFSNLVNNGKIINYFPSSILVYIAIVLVIIFGLAMFLLMKNKKKPNRFYLFLLMYFFVFIIAILYANSLIAGIIKNNVVNIQQARAYHDIARIIYYPQLVLLIFSLVRSVGFDIKSFNFGKDLNELNLNEKDREEFEFTLGLDYHNILVKLRNYVRELKYYFLENTFIIISLLVIGAFSLVVTIYVNKEIINKTYRETQVFSSSNFQFSIANSYLTDINQAGETIMKGQYYLVVDLNIKNISSKDQMLDLTDFTIRTRDIDILPVVTQNNNFVDLGIPYKNKYIEKGSTVNNILIFEVNSYTKNDKYLLKILSGIKYNEKTDQEEGSYVSVALSPQKMDRLETKKNLFYGTTVKFDESLLKKSSLLVNDYEIANNLVYKYNYCYDKDDCRDLVGVISADLETKNSTLLILDYDLIIDKKSIYSKNLKNELSFFDDYVTVKYTIEGLSRISTVKVANTTKYKEKVALQVTSTITNAEKIDLYITIRDKRYIISLK